MYAFQATIHARPAAVAPTGTVSLAGQSYTTFVFPAGSPGEVFPVTFEEAVEALARLPRMFVEPDGALVWVGDRPSAWQLDGVLYDRSGRLLYVDMKGRCPPADFDTFLKALGWPGTQLLFQLTREAVYLDESEFRRFASQPGDATEPELHSGRS